MSGAAPVHPPASAAGCRWIAATMRSGAPLERGREPAPDAPGGGLEAETPKQNNHSRPHRMAARGVFPYNTAPVPPPRCARGPSI
jgi:hypothetical protein